jgi:hypothetical protein
MLQLVKKVCNRVDAIALRNTVKVRPVKLNRDRAKEPAFPGRTFGGLSGPCTFGLTVRGLKDLVRIRKELKAGFGIVAIGGVSHPEEVVHLRDLGADAVQVCTAAMFDPFLAWKTRFHIRRISNSAAAGPSKVEKDFLIHPRNEMEHECYKNAERAIREIRKRDANIKVDHAVFVDQWNSWMAGRTNTMLGDAQKRTPLLTVHDWIKKFL